MAKVKRPRLCCGNCGDTLADVYPGPPPFIRMDEHWDKEPSSHGRTTSWPYMYQSEVTRFEFRVRQDGQEELQHEPLPDRVKVPRPTPPVVLQKLVDNEEDEWNGYSITCLDCNVGYMFADEELTDACRMLDLSKRRDLILGHDLGEEVDDD